ncbi:hypothetical protein [Persicobacter diffluens]|uniref:Uncharacterized protein n=1 Tax=Persicobacter diffluens TaxID=981 RepID=A0AAN4W465_9BACT|nr:hypothetical protein PEDI_45290 [Persicobacter diffluens]
MTNFNIDLAQLQELSQTLAVHPRINAVKVFYQQEVLHVYYHFNGDYVDWEIFSEVKQMVEVVMGNNRVALKIKGLPNARYNRQMVEQVVSAS